MLPLDFHGLQALADLRVAARAGLGALGAAVPGAALGRLVGEGGCRFEAGDGALELIEPLEAAARSGDPAAAGPAAAIQLADCLQGGLSPADLAGVQVTGTPPTRAALAHGLAAAARLIKGGDALDPPAAVAGTDRGRIVAVLTDIARAMTDAERDHIANADYGCGRRQHREALEAVLGEQECRMTPEQGWYPSETIELVAHVPGQPGFAGASALLMIAALENGDLHGNMEFRWLNIAASYPELPQRAATALLAGFRHLHETVPCWCPHVGAVFDPEDHHAAIIPPAAAEFLLRDRDAEP